MTPEFELDKFIVQGSVRPSPRPSRALPRHRKGELFLKGPVPWAWLEAAAKLPGKALAVGLYVWRQAGIKNSRTVKVVLGRVRAMGVGEDSARDALKALERGGLVSRAYLPGQGALVTLLQAPSDPATTGPEVRAEE